jgi:hypothetical protein
MNNAALRELGVLVGQILLLVCAGMIALQLRDWWKHRH